MNMELNIDELKTLPEGSYTLIDLGSDSEVEYGTIPGSLHIPAAELADKLPQDRERQYIVFARHGRSSREAAEKMAEMGYDVRSLKGGYNAWLVDYVASQDSEGLSERVEHSLHKKFRKSIWSRFTKALQVYNMLQEGDKIAVCISGGKDSMLLAKLFQELKKHSDFPFEVCYIVMDPGYSPPNRRLIESNCARLGIPVNIYESAIFESVFTIEKSPCYLCARMRRGHLYSYAKQLGCNKIALGHHYDDVIETILMGMLYGAQIQTMMPKLHSSNFEGMELIRPLYLCRESDIKHWRDYNGLHFLQCACKFTEDSANDEHLSKRSETKALIEMLKKTNPEVENHIFRSVENVNLSTVIAYKQNGVKHHFLDTYDESSAEDAE